MVFLLAIIALNVLIATYNARMVGRVWDLAKGAWIKTVLWSALVQSVIGYSMALVVGLGLGAHHAGILDDATLEATMNLWYLGVIFPCIMTGFIVWLHGALETIRNPSIGNVATTAWNTFAMYRNISGAFEHVPTAWKSVKALFGSLGDSSSGGKGKTGVLLVVISLIVGIMITALVFASGRRKTAREIQEMKKKSLSERPEHRPWRDLAAR